jgi:hypothetical protein
MSEKLGDQDFDGLREEPNVYRKKTHNRTQSPVRGGINH